MFCWSFSFEIVAIINNGKIPVLQKGTIHPFAVAKLKDDATNENIKKLLAFYRASGGRLVPDGKRRSSGSKSYRRNSTVNCATFDTNLADPRNHQRISVLFCSFSHYSNNSPEFCVNPWLV